MSICKEMNEICADCLWLDACSEADMENAAVSGCDHKSEIEFTSDEWRDDIDEFQLEWNEYIECNEDSQKTLYIKD